MPEAVNQGQEWKLPNIAQVAPTLEALRALSIEEQSCLLLRRLGTLYPSEANTFHKGNLRSVYAMDLATGFSPSEKLGVMDLLLARPWQRLLNDGHIVDKSGGGFFCITPEGYTVAAGCASGSRQAVPQSILSAIGLLHSDFQTYEHYFREGKEKEAVAAAFERLENRLNEIRDRSRKPGVKASSGHELVYALFREKLLKRPYLRLGSTKAKREALEKALCGLLSGALGWIRNPYTHEKHHLPDLEPQQALELLFVASYMMRMVELCDPRRH